MLKETYGAIGAMTIGATLLAMYASLTAVSVALETTNETCKAIRKMTEEESDKFWDKF
jgi:hypothetical protein